MNCSIIYYTARRTSMCEKALRRSIQELGLTLCSAVFATGRETLGNELAQAFSAADVVFTVGGLSFDDSRGIRDIVSQAAAGSHPQLCRRLKNNSGDDGFVIRSGNQLLVMLPDDPGSIESMTRGVLADYIRVMF